MYTSPLFKSTRTDGNHFLDVHWHYFLYLVLAGLRWRNTDPMSLFCPFHPQLSPFIIDQLVSHPQVIEIVGQAVNVSSRGFARWILGFTLPHLIAKRNELILEEL